MVQVPCNGTLALMDIRGRRIMVCDIAKNNSCIPLKVKPSAGLYIVKFSVAGVSEQRTVLSLCY